MLSCALEHLRQPNACCFEGIQGGSHKAVACSRVGVVGAGFSWNRGLALVGAVCGGDDDSKWYTSGPVHGFEWRRKHYAADRRAKQANKQDFQGLVADTTATPGPVLAGKGPKRPGKQARERFRRQQAKKRVQSSIRRPVRAQASGPRDQVEQTMNRQQQAPPNMASADDDDLTAPFSCCRTDAGGGEQDQDEFCARLDRHQRIIISNSGFDGAGGGKSGAAGDQRGFIRRWWEERSANQIGGGDGEKWGGRRRRKSWGRCFVSN